MDMTAIHALISRDMEQVDVLVQQQLRSGVTLIDQCGHYIVNSGGKRLRPALALLSAKSFAYQGQQHIDLAAIIEIVHTATLLHDDVVDASQLRRGKLTANQRWGNEASVLVGDFLYSRAFQMMVDINSGKVMQVLADATNTIAEGEVQQLLNRHDPDTSETQYLEVIHNKTAKLFEAAARLGTVIAGQDEAAELALATYGKHLGIAYQLIDDLLDYSASSDLLGKNIGDDLAEGKPTLPLLYAMWHGTPSQSAEIRRAIENGGLQALQQITDAIEQTGALTYTAQRAQQEAALAMQAIAGLAASEYKTALHTLAAFATRRTH
ncbi:MAG: polyprenyl synthetase family protein [Gammaproteobacteria bacterium]